MVIRVWEEKGFMIINYCNSKECERILNTWLKEKCDNMDLMLVNGVPILIEDCLSILTGSIINVNNLKSKLIVTTVENMEYVLEVYNK